MERLGVCMHGVTLTLEANYARLLAYAAEHLNGLVQPPASTPNIVVTCHWSQGEWCVEDNPFPGSEAMHIIGKRMLGRSDELIWLDTLRMKGLQLRFRRHGAQLLCDVVYRFHPKPGKREQLPDYEYKRFFSLMSYLVYYPLIWYLDYFRGWTVLHASALASRQGGIVIGGLGGVGKTTTCVALMQCADIHLMAENLMFTDGELLYPCPEPIRLDAQSLAMLGHQLQGLTPLTFPDGLKEKSLFHYSANVPTEQVRPAVLFLPEFAPQRYVTPLTAEMAAEKMLAINRLTRELDDYAWYAAALEMTWPKPGLAAQRIRTMHRFASQTRCFALGIDRSAGTGAVVDDILGTVHRT